MLAEYADCPYRAIGKQAQYCGGGGGTTVYSDTFETATGWTDQPERHRHRHHRRSGSAATPAATNSSGAKQLGTTVSGTNDLVTGRLAGAGRGRLRHRRRHDEHPVAGDHAAGHRHADAVAVVVPGARHATRPPPTSSGSASCTTAARRRCSTQAGAATNRNGAWAVGTREPDAVRRPVGPDPDRGGRRRRRPAWSRPASTTSGSPSPDRHAQGPPTTLVSNRGPLASAPRPCATR